jgi:CRISPR-associated protein Csm3
MELQLRKIQKLHGELELLSGLRIGASEGEIRIGGVDQQVIRHPYTNEPYIPGSSIKGKVRSLLEWLSGAAQQGPLSYKEIERAQLVRPILQLFGVGDGELRQEQAEGIGTDTARLLGRAVHRKMAQ